MIHSGPRWTVAVAGPGSGCGKTTLVCRLIRRFADGGKVAALKISTATPDHRCARTGLACSCLQFDGSMRILRDDCQVDRGGKDTALMLAAGAAPVWWVQATRDVALAATRQALDELGGVDAAVVEGSGPMRAGRADFAILIGYGDARTPKDEWLELAPHADALLLTGVPGSAEATATVRRCRDAGLAEDAWVGPLGPVEAPAADPALWERVLASRERAFARR